MLSKWRWHLLEWSRKLWVRAGFFVFLGVAAALVALPAQRFVELEVFKTIGSEAVEVILRILASSMLAVTTFSLAVVVAALNSAATSATPRATMLLMHDSMTQNALATFLGSFLYSIVGIMALSTGAYGDRGRVVLFGVTLLVIAMITVVLLRWIDHLSRLGQLSETMERVESATNDALQDRAANPGFGCNIADGDVPGTLAGVRTPVFAKGIGYIQHVDLGSLQATAEHAKIHVIVHAMPGAYVHKASPPLEIIGETSPEIIERLANAVTVNANRTYEQDPRFGLIVLAEIACRGLSPAVNDPGTAIGVIGRLVRLLAEFGETYQRSVEFAGKESPRCDRVWLRRVSFDDLFDDAFMSIARDGASMVEVQVRLLKGLGALREAGPLGARIAAIRHARLAMERSLRELTIESDRQLLKDAAAHVLDAAEIARLDSASR
jgi:uncharacterized membrane protein